MKQKTLLIMTLISTLLGCGNKISGPDFEHQENKVIVLNDDFRIDYQIPGNLSLFMDFAEKHKKQSKSITLDKINNLEYEKHLWRNTHTLDTGMWEYYRGKRNVEANTAANLSVSINIHKLQFDNTSIIQKFLHNAYESYLNGVNGTNTEVRKENPELSDEELGQWIVQVPKFNTVNINRVDYTYWHTYGEVNGRNLKYFITPINNEYYFELRFRYSLSAKNEKEADAVETMITNDINEFMKQLHISKH